MEKITILMSTYNGQPFLDKQFESIYKQENLSNIKVQIVIRDDGSNDNTIQIIKKWTKILDITFYSEESIGVRKSFYWLIVNAPESDYYAFCDQDDIWKNNKLSNSIKKIKELQLPATLYFSNLEYIDADDNYLNKNMLSEEFNLSLKRVFMCNPANGCTMVWDTDFHRILKNVPYDTFTMHDEFACTVAMVMGHVIYDPAPRMYYRLHNNNVTQSKNFYQKIKKTKQIWLERKPYSIDKRAKELLKYCVNESNKSTLVELSNYKKGFTRWSIIKKYNCEVRSISRSFRLRVLLGLA